MSDYQTKPNTGALFKNEKKEQDTHADYKGELNVNGVSCWVNAWVNQSAGGKKYMSLKVNPKEAQAPKPAQKQAKQVADSDDMPW